VTAQKKTDKEELGLLGPVRAFTEEMEQADKSRVKTLMVSFDKSGNKTEEVSYGSDGSIGSKTVYSYDSKGHLTSETQSDAKGVVTRKTSHRYDTNNRRIETSSFAGDDQPTGKTSYAYDAMGRLAEESYDGVRDKMFNKKTSYSYDDKGRLVTEKSEGDVFFNRGEVTYVYDDKGRLIKKTEPGLTFPKTWEYTYDDNGRRRQEQTMGPPRVLIKLDDKANIIERVSRIGSLRSPADTEEKHSYDFDAQGNWVKKTTTRIVLRQTRDRFGVILNPESEVQPVKFRTLTYY